MGVLAVDEVMLREPRLLVPRLQPVGPVMVDKSHPLAQGLKFCAIAGRPQNIASGNRLDSTAPVDVYKGVRAWQFSGGQYVASTNDIPTSATPMTMLVVHHIENTGNSQYLFALDTTTLADPTAFGLNSAQTVANDPYRLTSTHQVAAWWYGARPGYFGQWTALGVTATSNTGAAGSVVMYQDGTAPTTDTTDTSGLTPPTFTGYRLGARYDGTTILSYLTGYIAFAALWNLAISDAALRNLTVDPYQFLIPA